MLKGRVGPRTGRNKYFANWVKEEWIAQLKKIAYEEDIKYVEVLERSLDCYEQKRNERQRGRSKEEE